MNHPFIKMLKFEFKSNYVIWLLDLTISIGLLVTLFILVDDHFLIVSKVLFPVFAVLSSVFTINSYQESRKSQSMQMYHLIPVSRTMKFLSKQLITFVLFPLTLFVLTFVFISIANAFTNQPVSYDSPNSVEHSFFFLLQVWVLFHSTSTLFALVFKKNKVLYSILVLIVSKYILGIILLAIFMLFRINSTFMHLFSVTSSSIGEMSGIVIVFVAVAFYSTSYHLFFRRQL